MTIKTWNELSADVRAELAQRIADALPRCAVTRGPRKGAMLAKAPPASRDPDGYIVWHAVRAARHAARWGQLPNDCGIGGMMLLGISVSHKAELWDAAYEYALAKLREA